jgi:hypothetical protein
MENLNIIENLKVETGKGREVTQLVNSFLGVFSFPWEEWNKELKDISLDSPEGQLWPGIVRLDIRDEDPKTLGALVRLVRNAFSHGNIIFHSDSETDEITSLTVWNTHPDSGLRTWAATLDIATLRNLLNSMRDTVSGLREPNQPAIPRHHAERPSIPKPTCMACGQKVKPGNHRYERWLIAQQSEMAHSD